MLIGQILDSAWLAVPSLRVSGDKCFRCGLGHNGASDAYGELNLDRSRQERHSEMPTFHLLNDVINEQANNRSIYKSLIEIIHRLKSQASGKLISDRSDLDSEAAKNVAEAEKGQARGSDGGKSVDAKRTTEPKRDSNQTGTTVTLEIVNEPADKGSNPDVEKSSKIPKPFVQAAASTESFEERLPADFAIKQDSSKPMQASAKEKNLSEWIPSAQSAIRSMVALNSRASERSSRNNRKLDDLYNNRDRATNLMNNLLNDDGTRHQSVQQANQGNFQTAPWSRPVPSIRATNLMHTASGSGTLKASNHRERLVPEYDNNELADANHNNPSSLSGPLIEATHSKNNDYYASGSDMQPQQPDGDEQVPTSAFGTQTSSDHVSAGGSRAPINPQAIRLQQVYPNTPTRQTIPVEAQLPSQAYKAYDDHADATYSRYGSARTRGATESMLSNQMLSNQSPDLGASSYNVKRQTMQIIPLRTEPSRARLQQQPFTGPYKDLLDQPQTIQITAIPNNNNLITNGILGGFGGVNSVVRISANGQLGNGWNSNGYLDPFNRPVMMVNAERRQLDWSFWIWPLLAIITLPIILSALFVPIFLKTIITIIQILQSMGLLLPLANALGQQIVHATGVSAGSASLGALASTNQLATEHHHQKDEIGVRNVTTTTIFSNSTI